jgi:hypothetical protein
MRMKSMRIEKIRTKIKEGQTLFRYMQEKIKSLLPNLWIGVNGGVNRENRTMKSLETMGFTCYYESRHKIFSNRQNHRW